MTGEICSKSPECGIITIEIDGWNLWVRSLVLFRTRFYVSVVNYVAIMFNFPQLFSLFPPPAVCCRSSQNSNVNYNLTFTQFHLILSLLSSSLDSTTSSSAPTTHNSEAVEIMKVN